jgi:hypothetical protein
MLEGGSAVLDFVSKHMSDGADAVWISDQKASIAAALSAARPLSWITRRLHKDATLYLAHTGLWETDHPDVRNPVLVGRGRRKDDYSAAGRGGETGRPLDPDFATNLESTARGVKAAGRTFRILAVNDTDGWCE